MALAVTGGFLVVEAVGGWISNSLALLSDAGHMLTGFGALLLALFASWISRLFSPPLYMTLARRYLPPPEPPPAVTQPPESTPPGAPPPKA